MGDLNLGLNGNIKFQAMAVPYRYGNQAKLSIHADMHDVSNIILIPYPYRDNETREKARWHQRPHGGF